MRPIDADALMKSMYHRAFETDGDTMWQSGCWVRYRAIEQVVKEQPTADVQSVRHGRWVFGQTMHHGWMKCSECCVSQTPTGTFSYCPNCGARMDGEQND